MWTYVQRTGLLSLDGTAIATGYSGFGEGKNRPELEQVHDVGPIPRGMWHIGAPMDITTIGPHGPFVLPLTPHIDTAVYGRSGFLIHGDSVQHAGSASHGCIILPRPIREEIAATGESELEVISS